MTRRWLVTGGLGFLGAPLVRSLIEQGDSVRILDDASRGRPDRLGASRDSVEIVNADVRDAQAVRKAVRGIDSVCHLAFVNGTRHFYEKPGVVLEVGIKGVLNVMDACVAEGIRSLSMASSSEVYQTPPRVPTPETVPMSIPDPFNPRYSYAGAKIISELLALHYRPDKFDSVVIFRPHNVYGPDMGWEHVVPQFVSRMVGLRHAARTDRVPFPIQGSGDQTRAFIYIEDFTKALRVVLEKGHHLNVYNVGTMEEVTVGQLAERVAQHLGLRIRVVPGPPAEGATTRRCPDTRKLEALGFRPRFTLDQGLKPTVDWYVKHAEPTAPGAAPTRISA